MDFKTRVKYSGVVDPNWSKVVGEGTAVYISTAVGFTAAVAFRNS